MIHRHGFCGIFISKWLNTIRWQIMQDHWTWFICCLSTFVWSILMSRAYSSTCTMHQNSMTLLHHWRDRLPFYESPECFPIEVVWSKCIWTIGTVISLKMLRIALAVTFSLYQSTPLIKHPWHLPGMMWVAWLTTVKSGEDEWPLVRLLFLPLSSSSVMRQNKTTIHE